MTPEEQNRMLADRVLRLSDRVEKNTESQHALRRELYECREMWESLQRESTHETRIVGERLAKIEIVLGIVEREATGAHRKVDAEGQVVGGIRQFGALSDKHLRAAVTILLGLVAACSIALTVYLLLKK